MPDDAARYDILGLSLDELRRVSEALRTPLSEGAESENGGAPLSAPGAPTLAGRVLGAAAEALEGIEAGEAAQMHARRLLLDLPLAEWAPALAADAPRAVRLGAAIATVAQRSDFLVDTLGADPGSAALLLEATRAGGGGVAPPLDRAELESDLVAAAQTPDGKRADEDTFHAAVARWKRLHLARVGLRDVLGLATIATMMRELSELAEVILERAADYFLAEAEERHGAPIVEPEKSATAPVSYVAAEPHPAAFCVVSMGKGGGRELNFSSDVDLVFVYSGEGTTGGQPDLTDPSVRVRRVSNHDFYKRVAERLIGFLTRATAGGMIYRVDLRLRPDGTHGPLARSLDSYRDYFAVQALGWERVAYAKARAISGPRAFRDEVEATFATFVYAEIFNTEILPELGNLKARIDHQAETTGAGGLDIKRAPGGIRDIEFLLVALQLLYANDVTELRGRRSTLGLLDVLAQVGLLDAAIMRQLRADYLFLRALEQRLQLLGNRQTHTLPSSQTRAGRALLQRIWDDPPEALEAEVAVVRRRVRDEFHLLFRERQAPMPEALPLLEDIVREKIPDGALMERLAHYRLREQSSIGVIRRLNSGTREIYTTRRARKFFEAIFAPLINVAARVPFPDAALRYFEDFVRSGRAGAGYFELLAEYPRTLDVILRATGYGDFLAQQFARHPEFVDQLFSQATLGPTPPPTDHLGNLRRQFRLFKAPERRLRALRRHRSLSLLQLGVRSVLELDPWERTAAEISRLATASVRASLEVLAGAPLEDSHDAATPGFAILALGKLAIGELGFFSDLDVVFVADREDDAHTRLAEHLIAFLVELTPDGRAWEVDARLRPMGRTAPLVPSSAGLVNYFHRSAETWEFLAFTRAVYLAGDRAVAQRTIEGVGRAYARLEPALGDAGSQGLAAQVAHMRARLEGSVGALPKWAAANYKRGRGGLVNLEFARQAATLAALARGRLDMAAAGDRAVALDGTAQFAALDDDLAARWETNYTALRRLEAANRLLRGDSRDLLPRDADRLEPLGYALGRPGVTDALRDEHLAMLADNRAIFEAVLDALRAGRLPA